MKTKLLLLLFASIFLLCDAAPQSAAVPDDDDQGDDDQGEEALSFEESSENEEDEDAEVPPENFDEEPFEGDEPLIEADEGPFGFPPRSHECDDHHNCTSYSHCFSSYWIGQTCNTNLKKEDYRSAIYCLGLGDAGNEFPVHSHCAQMEAEAWDYDDIQYATSRCFPELGYTCGKAYFAPCTPNYNEETGELIQGQEESCPPNFQCLPQLYKAGDGDFDVDKNGQVTRKVCKPVKPAEPFAQDCKTSFDCGYSALSNEWPACVDGRCIRAIEKK